MSQPGMNQSELISVIAEALNLSPQDIPPDASSDSMEAWDSLGHLEVVLAVERAYHVKFTTSEIPQLTSVASLAAALHAWGVT